jgi:hypothetical protein
MRNSMRDALAKSRLRARARGIRRLVFPPALAAGLLMVGLLAGLSAGSSASATTYPAARRVHAPTVLSAREKAADASRAGSLVVTAPAATMSSCAHGLSHVTGGHFLVWACKGTTLAEGKAASADENAALAIAEPEYEPMTSVMGAPLADCLPRPACTAHGGGKISIYLLHPGQTVTRGGGPPHGLSSNEDGVEWSSASAGPVSSSGYILMHRGMAEADPALFKSVVVHEFFHVLTDHYNNSDDCSPHGGNYWFVETSAKWAESYWARPTAPDYVYDYFTKFQQNPDISLTDNVHRNKYAAFIWPYFMQQQTGGAGVIAETWRAMANARTCSQMTEAMNSVYPFADHFKDFAVENFDTELTNPATNKKEWPQGFGPNYPDKMDKRFPEIQPEFAEARTFTKPSTVSVPVNVPPLATAYHVINALEPAGALVIDFSTVARRSDLDIEGLITETGSKNIGGYSNYPWKRISIGTNNLSVCAYPDDEDQVKLILILANHSTTDAVSGSYTVTAQTSCAKAASGTLSLTSSDEQGGNANALQVNLSLFWVQCKDCTGLTQDFARGGGSWSLNASIPNCDGNGTTGTATGSGSYDGWGSGWLYAYVGYWGSGGYSVPKSWGVGIQATAYLLPDPIWTCGSISEPLYYSLWPLPHCAPNSTTPLFETGYWADQQHTVLDINCAGSNGLGSITGTGKITATGVILCGAFTKDCPIDVPPYPGSSAGSASRKAPDHPATHIGIRRA